MINIVNQSGIYCIINVNNNKRYIGQSIKVKSRFSSHKLRLRKNKHENRYLQNSYNKHGMETFKFTILEYCDYEFLNDREIYWIKYYNSFIKGYNLTRGGEGSNGIKGEQSHRFNSNLYSFYHDELGVEENKTMYYMRKKYNLHSSSLSTLVRGKIKTTKGWRLTKNKADPKFDQIELLYNFYHNSGNEEYDITEQSMAIKYNLNSTSIKQLTQRRINSYKGWVIEKSKLNTIKKNLVFTFININGEKLVNKTILELSNLIGVAKETIRKVINNKQLGTKGWSTEENYQKYITLHQLERHSFINAKGKIISNVTVKYMKETYLLNKKQIENMLLGKSHVAKGWKVLNET